jgi:hypothetical protein
MKRALLLILVGALYIVHQDFWFWRTARPLVFDILPIGLFYHACYTIATAFVIWLLVKYAWPADLEEQVGDAATDATASASASSFSGQSEGSSRGDIEK